jgi:hypothetical protein
LNTVKHVLAAIALDTAHYQACQVAVEVLFLLRCEGRLGRVGCRQAGGARRAALHCAAWHHLGGARGAGGGCFGAARGREFEVERFDLGFGVGEGGGQVGQLGLEGVGFGFACFELLFEAGGFFGGFFLCGELGFEGCDELVGRWRRVS